MKIINSKNFLRFTMFLSIYTTHVWINSFYLSPRNVDFSKYYDYINYFLGLNVEIDYGQGVLYYYLISLFLKSKLDVIDFTNYELVLNSAVQNVNLFLFLIGLYGVYRLLRIKSYESDTIFAVLIVLVFFPQSIYLRAVMKPEILGFALFPWILFFLEKYMNQNKIAYLFYATPFLAILINTKASIAGMTLLYLLISYFHIIKNFKIKDFAIVFLALTFLVILLQYESQTITGNSILDRPYDSEYDYKANPNIIYKFSAPDIIREPFFMLDEDGKTVHSNSVINLLILDTFGDYFNQLFDFQSNYFNEFRKNIFVDDSETLITKKREINYSGPLSNILKYKLDHLRKIVSVLWSIIFYFSIIYLSFKNKKSRKFYLAPFAGIVLLYINSLGVPSNNFNPIKGDTFKAFYFSLLLIISLAFVASHFFKKINFVKVTILIAFLLSVVFVSGHPKENSQFLSEHLISVNEHSIFCELNNLLIYENTVLKNIFISGNVNNLKSNCKPTKDSNTQSISRFKYDEQYLSRCVNENNEIINNPYENFYSNSNIKECRIYTFEQVQEQKGLVSYRIPYFSLLLFVTIFFIISLEKLININKINNHLKTINFKNKIK